MEGHFGFVEAFAFASGADTRQQKKMAVAGLPEVVMGHLRSVLPCRQVTWKVSSERIVPNSGEHQFVQDMMLVGVY